MFCFAAAGPETAILLQHKGLGNSCGKRIAKAVCTPFSNPTNSVLRMQPGNCDNNPVIIGKHPLAGHLPGALCIIVKCNRHITARNSMGYSAQYRQVDEQSAAYIGMRYVPLMVILLLSLRRVILKF